MRMLKYLFLLSAACIVSPSLVGAQVAVHIEPADLQGPRLLQAQTQTAVVRDYLQSWQSLSAAFKQNRAELLDIDFVGDAREKLTATIEQQNAVGIHTLYHDMGHDLQIVFYSPEGQSIELRDDVEYDVEVFEHEKPITSQHVQVRYIVVMTPAEVRWRVRVFQAGPQ